jgi:hypothetical protein
VVPSGKVSASATGTFEDEDDAMAKPLSTGREVEKVSSI